MGGAVAQGTNIEAADEQLCPAEEARAAPTMAWRECNRLAGRQANQDRIWGGEAVKPQGVDGKYTQNLSEAGSHTFLDDSLRRILPVSLAVTVVTKLPDASLYPPLSSFVGQHAMFCRLYRFIGNLANTIEKSMSNLDR